MCSYRNADYREESKQGLGLREIKELISMMGVLIHGVFWKTLQEYLSKLTMYRPLDPEFPLLEIILKATMSPRGLLEDNVCLSSVCKSEKWKPIQMVYQ